MHGLSLHGTRALCLVVVTGESEIAAQQRTSAESTREAFSAANPPCMVHPARFGGLHCVDTPVLYSFQDCWKMSLSRTSDVAILWTSDSEAHRNSRPCYCSSIVLRICTACIDAI